MLGFIGYIGKCGATFASEAEGLIQGLKGLGLRQGPVLRFNVGYRVEGLGFPSGVLSRFYRHTLRVL